MASSCHSSVKTTARLIPSRTAGTARARRGDIRAYLPDVVWGAGQYAPVPPRSEVQPGNLPETRDGADAHGTPLPCVCYRS